MKKTVFFLLFSFLFAFAFNFPQLTGRVVDEAGILSPQTKKILTEKLKNFEQNTSNQIVVVTLKSLHGLSIEEYGYKLGRKWGIGQKGKNNGVLLIVAPKERKVRIEVGYGLEGTLTDANAFLIINDIILPYFKKGDFDTGVIKGVDAIIDTLKGTFTPEKKEKSSDYSVFFFIFIFIYVIFQRFVSFLQKRANRIIPALFLSFFVYVITESLLISVIAFAVLFAVMSFFTNSSHNTASTGGYYPDGPENFTPGDFTDSDSFTGGGGSFGGGGASGSW